MLVEAWSGTTGLAWINVTANCQAVVKLLLLLQKLDTAWKLHFHTKDCHYSTVLGPSSPMNMPMTMCLGGNILGQLASPG